LIETWGLVFLIIYIRNRFIRLLQQNNVDIWQWYDIKLLFRHWSIIPPLIMLGVYIIAEIMIINNNYWITQYGTQIKQITIFSYFFLTNEYQLYKNQKYKDNNLISFIKSPFILAILFLCIGYLLNGIAVMANSGHMPVFPSNSYFTNYTDIDTFTENSFYILGDNTSKLIPLCDTIDIFYSILSIGDLFVRGYVFIILYYSIKYKNNSMQVK
jgi:hypothetical protein